MAKQPETNANIKANKIIKIFFKERASQFCNFSDTLFDQKDPDHSVKEFKWTDIQTDRHQQTLRLIAPNR